MLIKTPLFAAADRDAGGGAAVIEGAPDNNPAAMGGWINSMKDEMEAVTQGVPKPRQAASPATSPAKPDETPPKPQESAPDLQKEVQDAAKAAEDAKTAKAAEDAAKAKAEAKTDASKDTEQEKWPRSSQDWDKWKK